MEIRDIPIADIVVDDEILIRPLDEGTAEEYAEAMRHRAKFPPVDVFYDGKLYRCADGRHRIRGTELARREGEMDQRETISATIHEGGFREALIFACGANADHGLPRTNAEKVEAVRRLFVEAGMVGDSNRGVARTARVSHNLVVTIRRKLERLGVIEPQETVTAKRKDGTTYEHAAHPQVSSDDTSTKLTPAQKRVAAEVQESLKREKAGKREKDKPRPQTQHEIDCNKLFKAIRETTGEFAYDGPFAADSWNAYDRLREAEVHLEWMQGYVDRMKSLKAAS